MRRRLLLLGLPPLIWTGASGAETRPELQAMLPSATLLGSTSAVAVASYDAAAPIVADFDAAWADSSYSRASYTLGAGTYSITGLLDQSVLLDGSPLNATMGGAQLLVSAVPEPTSLVLMFAGLGALAARSRRTR